jgi:hypothetical protein
MSFATWSCKLAPWVNIRREAGSMPADHFTML